MLCEKGLTEEEYDELCEELKSSLDELNEKTWGKEATRDAEGPSTSKAPSDEQMEELQISQGPSERPTSIIPSTFFPPPPWPLPRTTTPPLQPHPAPLTSRPPPCAVEGPLLSPMLLTSPLLMSPLLMSPLLMSPLLMSPLLMSPLLPLHTLSHNSISLTRRSCHEVQKEAKDKLDRKRGLEDEGTSTDPSGESAKPLRSSQETNSGELQLLDGEDFTALHLAIEKGDLETVKRVVENREGELHFSHDDTSALYTAFKSKKHEIISFLIHCEAKFVLTEDVYDLDIEPEDLNRVNHHLFDYNKKSERSCIYKLMFITQSPQLLDADRQKAVMGMYEDLFESNIIKVLLQVLENVDFDIVFDFDSDKINKVHRLYKEEVDVFGLTLSTVREIYIGGRNLLSYDARKRAKVYGVVAEELCHLALTVVFQNDAKPYRKEDSLLIQEFEEIVRSVKSLKDRSCHIESVIEDIYSYGYDKDEWECELIARVPHVIGIHGEEFGRKIFQESSELYRLLIFYENNVLPKCREFMGKSLNTKYDRKIKQIKERNDFISFKEKRIQPLKEDFPSFRDCAVVEEGVYVISTNCIKLCALQVYHELKPVYGDQLERKCLFFDRECFEKKKTEILNALKCKLCDYLVLMVDNNELHYQILEWEYLDDLKEFESEGINVIVISNSQLLGPVFEENFVEYKWDDLTDKYKDFRAASIEYIVKREREVLYMKKENVLHLFSEEDITHIINGDLIEVRDGVHPNCQDYNPETYVERQFRAIVIDKSIFKRFPKDTVILIYGLQQWECKEFSINESCVQWLEGPDDKIQKGKVIFICNYKFSMNCKHFFGKTRVKNRICLTYVGKTFYLMNSEGDVFKQYEKEIRQTEEEMIDWLKNNKSLIVSENAGCGKSTVMSRLIRRVKERIHNSWVLRVDLNKFSIKDECSDSEKEMYEDIFLMFGFKNGFEKCHFRTEVKKNNCFIFLDAFDEIPSEYKTKALKLISFLRNKTYARIMITTRMHHQKELEETLNTFSHQLVSFDNLTQVTYLGNLWKWKLKFPNGEEGQNRHKDKKAISDKIESIIGELEKEKVETGLVLPLKEINLKDSVDLMRRKIDGLEINSLANSIINKTSLDEETLEFMGIPLHLYMTGVIHWDSNFKVNISSGIYSIYTQFIEKKIVIYVEEKQRMSQNIFYDAAVKTTRNDAYRIHFKLANELMKKGRIDCSILKEEKELELCKALGIVFIKGEDVEFLHLTFGEYFFAESIRLALNKETFADVLYDDKFTVVRRFLENSLKEKNFENISEVVTDFDFLLKLLTEFINQFPFIFDIVFSTSIPSLAANILKCLLQKLENTVDSDMLDTFVQKIESELKSKEYWHLIGGCVTVKIMKMLINRNFERNLIILFGVVRINSELNDVIEILDKCISTSDETTEREKVENVLGILELRGVKGRSLFDCAVLNERIEVFVRILEYLKKMLGNEKFIKEIIVSKEYRMAMFFLIERRGFNEVVEVIKTLQSVSKNETGMYFEEIHKIGIIMKSIEIRDKSRNAFKEAIDLFIECFGIENLKKTLLSCDSVGDYLIHNLVIYNINVIENLNIVKKYLKDKMKQFLMFKDSISRNVFYLAAKEGNVNFCEILTFCCKYLEKKEIKEMLISCDKYGRNVLYLLFENNSSERIIEILNIIKKCLNDEEFFKEILKSKNKYSMNILHFASINENELKYSFLNSHLSKTEIKNLLIEGDKDGETCLHWGAYWNSKRILILLNYSFEIMKDDQNQIKELILAKDVLFKGTFLHKVVESSYFSDNVLILIELIKSVKEKVSDELLKELLRIRNKWGRTFLQIGMEENRELIKKMEKVLEKGFVKELL